MDDRRRNVAQLLADPDLRFRPTREFLSFVPPDAVLDRPLVPLLNALVRIGLTPFISCAGHPDTCYRPYVAIREVTASAIASLEHIAARLPDGELRIIIGWGTWRRERFSSIIERCQSRLEWSVQRVFSLTELEALDRWALEAADALRASTSMGEVSELAGLVRHFRPLSDERNPDCFPSAFALSAEVLPLRLPFSANGGALEIEVSWEPSVPKRSLALVGYAVPVGEEVGFKVVWQRRQAFASLAELLRNMRSALARGDYNFW